MANPASFERLQINISGTGINKYPAKQHTQNVVCHLKASHGLIYIPGQHALSIEGSDFEYPFRQRRPFYYISGVDKPDCHLTYDIRKHESVLYIPKISPQQAVWFGRGMTLEEARDKYDVNHVRWSSTLPTDLRKWVDNNTTTTISTSQIFLLNPSLKPPNDPRSVSIRYNTTSLSPAIASSRTIKSPSEIALIRHAISISALAHNKIISHISTLRSEPAVHALFLSTCISHRAPTQAYPPIIASGPNSSILHYTANSAPFTPTTQLLTLDAGAEYSCYAADITRTFPVTASGTWPTPEAAALYHLVQEMQSRCIAAVKPGARFSRLYRLAQETAIHGLIDLGVLRIPATPAAIAEFIRNGAIYAFFPHGLGHHLGLDVHDVGAIDSQPTASAEATVPTVPPAGATWPATPCPADSFQLPHPATPLAPGMVITIEPGLYFNEFTLQTLYLKHAAFAAMVDMEVLARYVLVGGVRIEDDVLVTEGGCEVLSKGAVKGEEMLEVIKAGRGG